MIAPEKRDARKITVDELRDGCMLITGHDMVESRICTVNSELRNGLEVVQSIKRGVTFFGSARTPVDSIFYKKAYSLAKRISEELGYAVITGGGAGIMGAGNQGAYDAGGESIGFTIKLPMEQKTNLFLTQEAPFYYFFTRKVALSFAADAYLVFPGGYGTLDELTEVLTLVQTGKTQRVPIILVGVSFWQPFVSFLKDKVLEEEQGIDSEDLELFVLTDDEDEIIGILKNTPARSKV